MNVSGDDGVAVPAPIEDLARLSVAEHSLESVLLRVQAALAEILPGEPATSVTVVDGGRSATVAAGGQPARALDEVQYQLGDGPCVAAATSGRRSELLDTRAPERWAEFAAHAVTQDCRGVLSFPLPGRERLSGALNVYSRRPLPGGRTLDLVVRLAASAVVPLSNSYLYGSAVELAGHLQTALDSRAVIDQAKGILIERYKLNADQAFQVLTRVSMETNTKVRDVAERFVRTGELRPD